jgi:hypothetical protein
MQQSNHSEHYPNYKCLYYSLYSKVMKLIYRERPPNDCFARKIKVYNEVKSEQKLKVEKKNFIFKKIVNSRLNSSFTQVLLKFLP